MKIPSLRNLAIAAGAAILLLLPSAAFAARTDNLWDYPQGGNYYKTNGSPAGVDILIYGSNHYLNWGSLSGFNGYGIRDNGGAMEFKNQGGSWSAIGGGGGAVSSLTTSGSSGAATLISGVLNIPIYTGGAGSSGLATSSPLAAGNLLVYSSAGAGSAFGVATGTVSSSGGITVTAGQSIIGSGLTVGCTTATGSVAGCLSAADWTTFNGKQSALTFSTGLTNSAGTITVNTSQNISTLSDLTTNGFVQTSGGTGALTSAALTSGNITTALGFTPYNNTNPSSYIALTALSATYPVIDTSGVFSLAFGTTTANSWSGLQQFNGNASTTALSISGNLYLTALTGTQCLHEIAGVVSGTGSDCGSGTGGVTSITQTSGTAQSGALTFATSSAVSFNGLTLGHNITNSTGTFTFANTLTGTLNNSGLTNSTISGVSLGSNLFNLSATNASLTFSASYNGSAAATVGLNLANANTFTALQQFNGNASTTQFTDSGNLYLTALTGTQCLQEISGVVSGTGSACGSGGTTYTGTYPIQVTGSVISTAFSTTTANTFSALQTFNNASTTFAGQIFTNFNVTATPHIYFGDGTDANDFGFAFAGGRGMVGYTTSDAGGNEAMVFNSGAGKGLDFYVNGTNGGFKTGTQAATFLSNGFFGVSTTSPNSNLSVGGSFSRAIRTALTTTTLSASDDVLIETTSGLTGQTVTLPTAIGILGREYVVKSNATSTSFNLITTSSQTIFTASASTTLPMMPGDNVTVISDGANWQQI